MLCDKKSGNNGKDWRYNLSYQEYEKTIIPFFIKRTKEHA